MNDIIELEMNERKLTIAMIINDMRNNAFVSNQINTAISLFEFCETELNIWKYANESSYFQTKITEELNTNINGYQAFLQTVINVDNVTIYQYLMSKII